MTSKEIENILWWITEYRNKNGSRLQYPPRSYRNFAKRKAGIYKHLRGKAEKSINWFQTFQLSNEEAKAIFSNPSYLIRIRLKNPTYFNEMIEVFKEEYRELKSKWPRI